jgi:hypothetical protein
LVVNADDQRFELSLEEDVVVRAAQPALAAELVEGDSADRARLLIQAGQFLGGLADRHLICESGGHACHGRWLVRRRGKILPGVGFAEMQFLRLAAGQLGDVERRRLIALLALHRMSVNY